MNNKFLFLLAVFALSGCASNRVVPSVERSVSVEVKIPYKLDIEDAAKIVATNVSSLMVDDAARSVKDNEHISMRREFESQLILDDSNKTREGIIETLINHDMKASVDKSRGSIFNITRSLPSHSVNGDVFKWNLSEKTDNRISGDITIGRNFCWYNSSSHQRSCNETERYAMSLDGTYKWVNSSTLLMAYTLSHKNHSSAIGLDSDFSSSSLANAIDAGIKNAGKEALARIDKAYKTAISNSSNRIIAKLENRLSILPEQVVTLREQTFNTGFETSVARLQRRLDKFKYDKDSSTFVFENDHQEKFKDGASRSLSEKLIIKLFPERSSTVAVYKLSFSPITDSLTGKEVYGKDAVVRRYSAQIAEIDAVLKK